MKKCAALAELLFLLIKPIDFFWRSINNSHDTAAGNQLVEPLSGGGG